jgi:hypothetical protein
VREAGGKVPSEKIVRAIVNQRKAKDICKAPNPFQVGQVVTAKFKKGWFVVKDAGEFSCTLESPTGEKVQVNHFDVRSVELPKEQRDFMVSLQERLASLWQTCDEIPNLQESATAKAVIEAIAFNLGGGFLSELQELLLDLIEKSVEF